MDWPRPPRPPFDKKSKKTSIFFLTPPLTHGEILRVGKEAHIYHVLSFQKAVKLRARVLEVMYLCRGIIIVSFFQMMIYL